ncbi:MAG: PDZ domain-containing protein [Bacteroidales bacterium]|nr:PDZ domain-containing protein [Bacteroidales bacterium]
MKSTLQKQLSDNRLTRSLLILVLFASIMVFSSCTGGQKQATKETISLTISMENPNNHYFHVSLNYSGISSESVDFKLPSWTPGYYMIMDYAKYIVNFKAVSSSGESLSWEKTAKNVWKVQTVKTNAVTVSYDVFSFRTSVADSFLDDGRGFISPTGIFMHPAGKINNPVTVTVIPYEKFSQVSTGLDPVKGKTNTFYVSDFDVLYDSPILAGNQEILTFEVNGIPYTVAAEKLGDIDRKKFIDDHKKMVESAIAIVGEIPYKHYTFLIMNRGGGGLEHTNSMAVFSSLSSFNTPEGYKRWLGFVAHEFFHLYNVKTIRPIALGPFDYDKENYTTMLWFSEGVTSYYENIILNRAGLFNRIDVLGEFKASIANYENIPGHLFQSAAQSSFDAWILFFNRSENAQNTTISYYDKGCALGMLLDLKIRYETKNQKSLDDVMRTLYQLYYKEKKRGFTDKEFREVCESIAGSSLSEIFDAYIPTVQDLDYTKYLGYAGLSIDMNRVEEPGAFLGATTRENGDNLLITRIEWNSPAYTAGLSPQDIITEINGKKATLKLLNDVLNAGKPGDKITISFTHREINNTVVVTSGKKTTRSFEMKSIPDPTTEQAAILDKWLK